MKFLLLRWLLKPSERLWEFKVFSAKMKSLEIFMTSPHYCYNECMGTRKEKLYFDVRVWRVKTINLQSPERISILSLKTVKYTVYTEYSRALTHLWCWVMLVKLWHRKLPDIITHFLLPLNRFLYQPLKKKCLNCYQLVTSFAVCLFVCLHICLLVLFSYFFNQLNYNTIIILIRQNWKVEQKDGAMLKTWKHAYMGKLVSAV